MSGMPIESYNFPAALRVPMSSGDSMRKILPILCWGKGKKAPEPTETSADDFTPAWGGVINVPKDPSKPSHVSLWREDGTRVSFNVDDTGQGSNLHGTNSNVPKHSRDRHPNPRSS
jgi:hypothetical protein